MGGLRVDGRDVERVVAYKSLDEELRAVDARNEGDGTIDSRTPSALAFAGMTRESTEVVFGWEIDVEVDEIAGRMLSEGALGLLVVGPQYFQVLDEESV